MFEDQLSLNIKMYFHGDAKYLEGDIREQTLCCDSQFSTYIKHFQKDKYTFFKSKETVIY